MARRVAITAVVLALGLLAAFAGLLLPGIAPVPGDVTGIAVCIVGVAAIGYLPLRQIRLGVLQSLLLSLAVVTIAAASWWAVFWFVVVPGIRD
jgi:hypothetical protein